MEYFSRLLQALQQEKQAERQTFRELAERSPVAERRENGFTWFPIAVKDVEPGRGDYLTVEVERTSFTDIQHQFRFGMTVALFSNQRPKEYRLEGVVSQLWGDRMKISLRVDELPDWFREGRLGVDVVFDENSYAEMEQALHLAAERAARRNEESRLIRLLLGEEAPPAPVPYTPLPLTSLNPSQQAAVAHMLGATDICIIHGPPGTGKTTTLVHGIRAMVQQGGGPVLVAAPSNAAVDLLSERLAALGLRVVRIGNPARVSEAQMHLTLDEQMAAHDQYRTIRKLKKQAAQFRDMAQTYKRNFGPAEREQRKALFAEARNILKEVDSTEKYIADSVLRQAQVVTATLVGAAHETIRHLHFHTVVIDEAGQALEPACWIPVLRAKKLVLAGDHNQLPPTVKSREAAPVLNETLLEKLVNRFPAHVHLLDTQYRMHRAIMQFSSDQFYGGQLQAHATVAGRLLFEGDQPLVFVDTAGCGYEEVKEGTGISNPEEVQLLVKLLHAHAAEWFEQLGEALMPSVAVISPYKHQVTLLRQALEQEPVWKAAGDRMAVNTVDSFQGQERDVVYISLVRSNADNSIGFLSEIRRLNVAMTRARKKLVVIGDSATLSQYPFYAAFIQYAENSGGYKSAWEYL